MTSRTAALDHGLLGRLRDAAGVPLVLHGSSGVPDEEVRAAVRGGITKVNVGTALNVALTAAVRERLGAEPGLVDARGYLGAGREAMAEVVERLTRVVAGAGRGWRRGGGRRSSGPYPELRGTGRAFGRARRRAPCPRAWTRAGAGAVPCGTTLP